MFPEKNKNETEPTAAKPRALRMEGLRPVCSQGNKITLPEKLNHGEVYKGNCPCCGDHKIIMKYIGGVKYPQYFEAEEATGEAEVIEPRQSQ